MNRWLSLIEAVFPKPAWGINLWLKWGAWPILFIPLGGRVLVIGPHRIGERLERSKLRIE